MSIESIGSYPIEPPFGEFEHIEVIGAFEIAPLCEAIQRKTGEQAVSLLEAKSKNDEIARLHARMGEWIAEEVSLIEHAERMTQPADEDAEVLPDESKLAINGVLASGFPILDELRTLLAMRMYYTNSLRGRLTCGIPESAEI